MIAGLDSSFDAPTLDQAKAAYAAGIRAWGGYLVSTSDEQILAARAAGRPAMFGLASPWTRAEFARVQQAGLAAIGFCSGKDDPDLLRAKAAAWNILHAVDVEHGIRDDGPWVSPWVRRAQSGLYGAMSVHYQNGEEPGRGAAFNILAWYPGYDPQSTWFDAIELRPPGPCGWQWWGTHTEFGLSVDRMWLDDAIIPTGPGRGGDAAQFPIGGDEMPLTIARKDGTKDVFDVDPSGKMWHTVITSAGAPYNDKLPGDWCRPLGARWNEAESHLTVIGRGWQNGQGGSIFQLDWDASDGQWSGPTRLAS